VNADGALNVFWAAVQEGTRRVVYASSSSVYGDSEALPKKEGSEGAPLSPYALTKKNNEEYAFLCARLYGLETVGLRYFNIYGPRQDPDSQYAAVIPRFVAALTAGTPPTIYGTGKQTRDFTYVKDAVSANLAAMETPGITAAAVNIGRGSGAGVLEILDIIKELLGVHIEPRFDPPRAGDVMHSTADIQAALNLLGFTAQYTLQAGLDETIAWYKENL
jgi:nucleoside-diphosphate-sugar epimerase